ncbi:flagellin [Halalkaliarchaeum desulfuricum]|uniref:Flagellin n=2 Tax=Halalkaliarchaeum desulfuricum TaxID=2055893 RepID=A0A343TN75_9EURY|nr:flagellin [Halalkaliarchaeum desulfuricum]
MVAITVILAAVIGTFVLGLGDQVGDTAPNSQFEGEQLTEDMEGQDVEEIVDFRHTGGDSVEGSALGISVSGLSGEDVDSENIEFDLLTDEGSLSAGDTATVEVEVTGGDPTSEDVVVNEGTEISLTWESGDRSSVLRAYELPNDIEYGEE